MKPNSPRPRKKKRIPVEFSPRELQIVRHIAAGRTSKAIAAPLYLSRKTVESHRANMFSRLKVRSAAGWSATLSAKDTSNRKQD